MDDKQRLNLQKIMKENNVEETTEKIRELKHSKRIMEDLKKFALLKKRYSRLSKTNKEQFKQIARNQCSFLHKNYIGLFGRLLNNNLDLGILGQFLSILKRIENGKIDQHEGSFEVGKLLKKIYVDSALKNKESNDKIEKKNKKKAPKKITWNQYKKMQ